MAILTSLQKTFLPSPQVAAARRKDVFGTTSKGVAAAAVVGTAAALIAAPTLITKAGGIGGVAKGIASGIGKTSLGTKAALAVGTPIAAGAIVADPKILTRTTGGAVNFGSNLYDLGKNPTVENAIDVFKENPVIATVAGATIVGATAGGAATAIQNYLNREATQENTEAIYRLTEHKNKNKDNILTPPIPPMGAGSPSTPTNSLPAPIPLTQETMVVGKEAGVRNRKRSKKITAQAAIKNNVRVNIINQNI